mgnify:CR=1 FL=1
MAHSTMVSKILVGAWLSAAVLTWAGLFALSFGQPGELIVGGVTPAAWIVLASTSALIAVSLMTEPPSTPTLDRYFSPTEAAR